VAARWNEDDFLSADETTHDVIRRLHGAPEERYWPPATRPPPFSEAYSGICQERRFGKMATPAEEDIAS